MACIVGGGLVGLAGKRFMTQSLEDALTRVCGASVLFVAIAGAMEEMLQVSVSADGTAIVSSTGSMMMVASLALGTVIGELVDLDRRFEGLGIWLRAKTGNEDDATFVNAFVTATLTVCVGAMAIVGSIEDGMGGDWSTLALKGALDAIIVCAMAASLGKGAIFSALPVGVFQGAITLLASLISPYMTEAALSNISLVGSVLIFCVGVNLIWPKTFKPANMLPSIVIAAVWALVP